LALPLPDPYAETATIDDFRRIAALWHCRRGLLFIMASRNIAELGETHRSSLIPQQQPSLVNSGCKPF
jgi:hypothetical protein